MAHERARYLSVLLRQALTWAPSVGISGIRQVGKSTLLRKAAASYHTLDDEGFLGRLREGDYGFLDAGPFPMAIDEIQKHPPLFDALKLRIDRVRTPGRYLVSGSVRFASRKGVRESLTGRMAHLELFPLTLAEAHQRPLHDFFGGFGTRKADPDRVLERLSRRAWATRRDVDDRLETGGLPGIALRRDSEVRGRMFRQQLDTLLGRDLSLIQESRLGLRALLDLFAELSREPGAPVSWSALARRIGVSPPTARRLCEAYEGLFLVRRHGRGRGETFFPEDLGLARFACGPRPRDARAELLHLVHAETSAQLAYLHAEASLESYWTRGGIEIPFVVRLKGRAPVGVCVDADEHSSEKSLKGLTYFRKRHPGAVAVAVHLGARGYLSSTGVYCLPREWLF